MIDLKFPDGAVRQYPAGSTARDVAQSISPSLAKKAVLAELNGQQRDMGRVLETGGVLVDPPGLTGDKRGEPQVSLSPAKRRDVSL